MNKFTQETDEYLPVAVNNRVAGTVVPVTEGVEFSITEDDARPVTWTPAVDIGGVLHVRVNARPAGSYAVWARITTVQETAVVVAGFFVVV